MIRHREREMVDITSICKKRTRNNCSDCRGMSVMGEAVKEFEGVIKECRCIRGMSTKGRSMLNEKRIPTSAVVKNDFTPPYGFTVLCVIEQKTIFFQMRLFLDTQPTSLIITIG
jgi:hypothetical protein